MEILRKQLIQTGIHQGLTSEETLNVSRKLDNYIKRYLVMKKSN
ncbi:aspartyl-phosphate phosphatase Spo0E family protein [Neobacillus driksii]